MNTITLKLTMAQIEQLKKAFSHELVAKEIPYAFYQIKTEGCTITAYTSMKVVFQGEDANIYAGSFLQPSKEVRHAGSDEVGTGDYFGPVCVCAVCVEKEDLAFLRDLGVQDSKMLKDENIIQIAPQIMKRVQYSLLILDNAKYNQIQQTHNLNQIKAKMHNQAYINLMNKGVKLPHLIVVDQFAEEDLYYRYLESEKQVIRDLTFETKAESKYLAVAAASVIARYSFLESWKKMEQTYQMTFTKGASDAVDQDALRFVRQYGFERLSQVAKLHFKNTEKVKSLLQPK